MGFDQGAELQRVLFDVGPSERRRVLHLDGAHPESALLHVGRVDREPLPGGRAEGQRVKVDQMVNQRYGAMINKIATRSVKVVKKKELEKVKQARMRKQDA